MKNLLLSLLISPVFCLSILSQTMVNEYKISENIDAPKFNIAIDIENDGDQDLLVYTTSSNELVLYTNFGNGDFGAQRTLFTTSAELSSACVRDIDNDGYDDLIATVAAADSLIWYKNINGNFGLPQLVSNQIVYPFDVKSDDLNGDGLFDIVTASMVDNIIIWHQNLGNGIFGPQQIISNIANDARHLDLADLDGDLDLDIISGTVGDNRLSWYENLGSGLFGPQQIVNTLPGYIGDVFAADINGDSRIDLIVSDGANEESYWHRNLGGGTFGPANWIPGEILGDLNTKDINQDGFIDLIGLSAGSIIVLSNNGVGVFTLLPNGNGTLDKGVTPCIFDVDQDGDFDIVASAAGSNSRNIVFWHENHGGGVFGGWSDVKRYIERNPAKKDDMVAGDIDNDGDVDLVTVSEMMVSWHKNMGNGEFTNAKKIKEYMISNPGGAVDIADLDNDGDLDVILGNDNYTGVMENLGGGEFSNYLSFPILTFGYIEDVIVKDLNNDGLIDIVYSTYGSGIKFVENLGGFNFSSPVSISSDNTNSVFSADLDGDLDNDIVATSDNGLFIYANLGSGLFGSPQLVGYSEKGVHCADLDNDGDFDILGASYQTDKVVWYENFGGLSFSAAITVSLLTDGVLDITTGDIDNDGDLEIFSASGLDKKLAVYENLGGGLFGPQQVFYNGDYGPNLTVLADYDNDGDLDIASSRYKHTFWLNNDLYNSVSLNGRVFVDSDQNGVFSSNDIGVNMLPVYLNPSYNSVHTGNDGIYNVYLSDANSQYNITIGNLPYWDIVTDSSSYQVDPNSNISTLTNLDFGLYPNTIFDSVSVDLVGMFPRCNQVVNYYLNISNSGTTIPSGVIHLELDNQLTYIGSPFQPDSVVGQNIFWSYNDLPYFDDTLIVLQVMTPDFNSIGDTLSSYLTANIVDVSGIQLFENTIELDQILVCAYDPNDKISNPIGLDSLGYISQITSSIDYTIRFQNTGNDTAIVVEVTDQLDSSLDWHSLTYLSSSHSVNIKTNENGKVFFRFENIMLPDSTSNEIESHGYLKYRIKLNDNLPIGTQINNFAEIYFDANPPVITNTKILTLDSLHFLDLYDINFNDNLIYIYPNPFEHNITIRVLDKLTNQIGIELYNLSGSRVYHKKNFASNGEIILDNMNLEKGMYLLRGVDDLGNELFIEKVVAK